MEFLCSKKKKPDPLWVQQVLKNVWFYWSWSKTTSLWVLHSDCVMLSTQIKGIHLPWITSDLIKIFRQTIHLPHFVKLRILLTGKNTVSWEIRAKLWQDMPNPAIIKNHLPRTFKILIYIFHNTNCDSHCLLKYCLWLMNNPVHFTLYFEYVLLTLYA